MAVEQLSIFLDNTPGRLAQATKVLGEHGIDIIGFSVADTTDFGIVRFIVDDIKKASAALKGEKFTVGVSPVVIARVPDAPGELAAVLTAFAAEGINVDYAYEVIEAVLAFGVEDVAAGELALRKAGIPMVTEDELFR